MKGNILFLFVEVYFVVLIIVDMNVNRIFYKEVFIELE